MKVDNLVAQVLLDRLDSVEQCEILVTMHASGDRRWTARELATALSLPTLSISLALENLATRGLLDIQIANDVHYRLRPVSEELNAAVTSFAATYPTNRTGVVSAIVRRNGART